jgi:hypothetical protein
MDDDKDLRLKVFSFNINNVLLLMEFVSFERKSFEFCGEFICKNNQIPRKY